MEYPTGTKGKWLLITAICMIVASAGMGALHKTTEVYADTQTVGIVNDGPVNVRSAPVNGAVTGRLSAGTEVSIAEKVSGSDGYEWYQVWAIVDGTPVAGYMRADYVALPGDGNAGSPAGNTPAADGAYTAQLKAAGFPDSYCGPLAALHEKYPSWQFVPVNTGLDFYTVIENESVVGRNLIQSSVNDARKSTDAAAYDWATNTWYGFDGAGWVGASSEYIAYCMDPRNFLNEKYIFQFETLDYAPYQDAQGVSSILKNTFMAGNYTDTDGAVRSYADTFVQIGADLLVSPYHLASRCRQEQGNKGTSKLISGDYSGYAGYYNYFNVRAYTTSAASSTVNGLAYAKQQGWDSVYKSIAGGSAVVADNYIKKGQNTVYFEKFNVVYQKSLYSHQYMTNVQAAMSEGSSMGEAYAKKNQAFVFRIPIYTGMPDSAVTFKDKGNPNNWLSAVTVDGYSLTPVFHPATTEYSLIVGADVASVDVEAVPVAGTSSVTGTGDYPLNFGNNTITVTCTSQSGAARSYTITVARQQGEESVGDITVGGGASFTSVYPVGSYVTGIAPGTKAGEILSGITASGCTAKILNPFGSENTGEVGTGNTLAVYVNGSLAAQYPLVIYGDINGDGKASNVDLVLMQKQILGITGQSGCYLEAANTSRDGGVTNKDLVILQKHILGIAPIGQQ